MSLRVELDQINRDEKRVILEASRTEKEAALSKAKEGWEKNFQKVIKEVSEVFDHFQKNILIPLFIEFKG